jgi:CRISPR-associated endoribonuclease Cas6
MGENSYHDNQSNYSLGWLKGESSIHENKIWFKKQVTWDIGLPTTELEERVTNGIENVRFHLFGMNYLTYEILDSPNFSNGKCRFMANSPILLRKSAGSGSRRHVLYSESDSDDLLTAVGRKKAEHLDIPGAENLRLTFDRNYSKAKTRLVTIKKVKLRGSVCPILAEGPPAILKSVWVTGAGELTGSAFGALDFLGHNNNQ